MTDQPEILSRAGEEGILDSDPSATLEGGRGAADAPTRITLSRVKGYRRPEGTIQVDRATIFGNPWQVGNPGRWWVPRGDGKAGWQVDYALDYQVNAHQAVIFFSAWLHNPKALAPRPPQLTWEGREWLQRAMDARREAMLKRLPSLRGHNLGCRCKPGEPCHADVLLELANR